MREKVLGPLLGGALLLNVAVGCCVDKKYGVILEDEVGILEKDVSSYAGRVVCIRSTQRSMDAGSDAGSDVETRHSIGSGFVYRRVNGWTYVFTARHVGIFDQYYKVKDGVARLWGNKGSGEHTIVDDMFDAVTDDDVRLEKYYEDDANDFVVFRSRADLQYSSPHHFAGSEHLGDEVVVYGFVFCAYKLMSHGVYAGEVSGRPVLNLDITKGFSGGPFFIKKNGAWGLAGFMTSILSYGNGEHTGFSRGVWLRDVIGGLETKLNEELTKGMGGTDGE